jgi:DNA polymerase-3 subunit beta
VEFEGEESASLTIPARSLQELLKMLPLCDEDFVCFQVDEGIASFEWTNYKLTTRIIEGMFPNYRQLVPQQFERTVTTDKKELISILDRLSVLCDQSNGVAAITLKPDTQELLFYGEAKEAGMGFESLSAQVSGSGIDIAFNIKYLLEGLKAIPGNEISIHLNSPMMPAIFKPIGGTKMTYLAMPVQPRS